MYCLKLRSTLLSRFGKNNNSGSFLIPKKLNPSLNIKSNYSKFTNNITYGKLQKLMYSTNKPKSLKELSESFLNGSSAYYVETLYESWKMDPSSVHVSWAAFFHNMESGALPGDAWVQPPQLGSSFGSSTQFSSSQLSSSELETILSNHYKLIYLIRAYQVRGHELANIDPLGILNRTKPKELQLETYGFTENDLDKEFFLSSTYLSGALSGKSRRTLREILKILEQTYCRTIGVEFMHIQSREQSNWIRERVELDEPYQFSAEEKHIIMDRLVWASNFESFLKTKYVTSKR